MSAEALGRVLDAEALAILVDEQRRRGRSAPVADEDADVEPTSVRATRPLYPRPGYRKDGGQGVNR
ncbi:hypothetical protein [Sorangium sp. So ce1182]|uniref:hypothetical protein n=1 Tax=Sorangium sp. So ce1182 TaxID=3133334 RepID=UPI003F5E5CC9